MHPAKAAHSARESEPEKATSIKDRFRRFAVAVSHALGNPWAFVLAILSIVVWGLTGPIFHYSDTWQLIINTSTTIITFLMVFLVQNTQNRDGKALQLKLDELIRALKGARNDLVNLETLNDEELDRLQQQFETLRKRSADPQTKRALEDAEDKVEAVRDLDLATDES